MHRPVTRLRAAVPERRVRWAGITRDRTKQRRRADHSEWLPDAAAVQAEAYTLHRAGRTGRGVTLALVDTGVSADASWFTDRAYCLSGDPCEGTDDHGTAMAAVMFSVAPDIQVRSYRVGRDPEAAFRRACDSAADLVVAAWGTSDVAAPDIDASRCITVRDPDRPRDWPGRLNAHAIVVGGDASWPTGPFRCDAVPRAFEGASVAVAVAAGVAALLIDAGSSPAEAARLVVAGPASVSAMFARHRKD